MFRKKKNNLSQIGPGQGKMAYGEGSLALTIFDMLAAILKKLFKKCIGLFFEKLFFDQDSQDS